MFRTSPAHSSSGNTCPEFLRDSCSSFFALLPDVSLIQSHACLYPHTGHGIVGGKRAASLLWFSRMLSDKFAVAWCDFFVSALIFRALLANEVLRHGEVLRWALSKAHFLRNQIRL